MGNIFRRFLGFDHKKVIGPDPYVVTHVQTPNTPTKAQIRNTQRKQNTQRNQNTQRKQQWINFMNKINERLDDLTSKYIKSFKINYEKEFQRIGKGFGRVNKQNKNFWNQVHKLSMSEEILSTLVEIQRELKEMVFSVDFDKRDSLKRMFLEFGKN